MMTRTRATHRRSWLRCRDASPAFSSKPCKALETKVGEERVRREEKRRGRWPRREERAVEGVPR